MMAQEGVEEVELTEPWKAVKEAGGTAELIAPEEGEVQAFNHLDKASKFPVDRALGEVRPSEYDAVVLPGGVANPDELRLDERAVRFLQEFFSEEKPVGVICHGPWTLVEGDLVRDRTITSWPSLKTDIRNAGGNWVDEEIVVDDGLVSSRKPDDLPAFCAKIVEEFQADRSRAGTGAASGNA
jgi:protease I